MDWLEAVSSWIGSLAWPAAVILLVLMLKKPLTDVLGKLSHLEAPGVKADFAIGLAEAEADVEILTEDLPVEASTPTPPAGTDTSDSSAAKDPSGAIIRAWERLYNELVEFATVTDVLQQGKNRSIRRLVHVFQTYDLLERRATMTILELLELRNRVAHGDHVPTAGESITYETTADNLRGYVRAQREHTLTHGRGDESLPAPDDPSRS